MNRLQHRYSPQRPWLGLIFESGAGDQRIELCPRALAVLRRHLALRERLVHAGRINHELLFFHADGQPIDHLSAVYARWRRTLTRLPTRYRKPYAARHSSVSWNLMIGGNVLFVSKPHGHSVITMLTTYAAWLEGAQPMDVRAIEAAMNATGARPAGICVREPRRAGRIWQ